MEYQYRSTTALDQACDARSRSIPVDLVYVIFIEFLALGVLRFCFLLLSNVQFLVLVNLPPGRSHAGGISSRHSRRRYPESGRWSTASYYLLRLESLDHSKNVTDDRNVGVVTSSIRLDNGSMRMYRHL